MNNNDIVSIKLPFAQLWVEEQALLFAEAAKLRDNSVIVEIGTAQGGSAKIFSQAIDGKNIDIYSYDISPSEEAFLNLSDTNVKICAMPSVEGARIWNEQGARPIDLIFIDGSHTLWNVYEDYHAWLPYLRKGSRILFHDYDPIEKGGRSHLGVFVFLRALLKANIVVDISHVGRILAVTCVDPGTAIVSEKSCFESWSLLGAELLKLVDINAFESVAVGPETKENAFIMKVIAESTQWLKNTSECSLAENKTILVFQRPFPQDAMQPQRIICANDLIIDYILYVGLCRHRNSLLQLVNNRNEFFKHEELLDMLNHTAMSTQSIEDIFSLQNISNVRDLSALCARELLRLYHLDQIRMLLMDK